VQAVTAIAADGTKAPAEHKQPGDEVTLRHDGKAPRRYESFPTHTCVT
jgi:hypothetical protein